MKEKKREPWRIVAFIIAAAYIVYMWVENARIFSKELLYYRWQIQIYQAK